MELRDRKLCTLEGVVLSSCAIQSSLRPSSTQRRIFDACGFNATLLFPTAPCSFDRSSLIGYMYHFLLPDARCILLLSRKTGRVPKGVTFTHGATGRMRASRQSGNYGRRSAERGEAGKRSVLTVAAFIPERVGSYRGSHG